MNLTELLADKTSKAKEKTAIVSKWLLENIITVQELVSLAEKAKGPAKATCIERLAFATNQIPKIVDKKIFQFVTQTLTDTAPRAKWESAKVSLTRRFYLKITSIMRLEICWRITRIGEQLFV